MAVTVALPVKVTVAAVALVALASVALLPPLVTVQLVNVKPSGTVVVMGIAVFALTALAAVYAVPLTFIVLTIELGFLAIVSVWVVGVPPDVQLAVTVTAFGGMAKVVIALLALARVTPAPETVQPLNVKPLRVPALMVTVLPLA